MSINCKAPDYNFKTSNGDSPKVRQWLKDNGYTWNSGEDLTTSKINKKFLRAHQLLKVVVFIDNEYRYVDNPLKEFNPLDYKTISNEEILILFLKKNRCLGEYLRETNQKRNSLDLGKVSGVEGWISGTFAWNFRGYEKPSWRDIDHKWKRLCKDLKLGEKR